MARGGDAFSLDVQGDLIAGVVTILVASVVVYFAAKMVLDRSSFLAALGTVVLGTLLAGVVTFLLGGLVGVILAAAAWAFVAAIFFRASWVKGAIVGLVAWVLWALVRWVVGQTV